MEILQDAFIYLLAAVIAVPIAKRLGLGSVLGYLIAGIIIGPALGIIGAETEEIKHFAEFGVVMMLFLVGLELQPLMLWQMRKDLIGLGGLQVSLTIIAVTLICYLLGLSWQISIAIGMTLSLSSTAIILQTLNEKGIMKTPAGQSAFAVLLFQDIIVIPMLAIIPLLAVSGAVGSGDAGHHSSGLINHLPGWLAAITVFGVIVGIVGAGRYLIKPIFRFIAESHLREIFTAAALLLVIATALLMHVVGLSPALGTFLAGVVLSTSEYRHELESDIEPFKGLLLGLFFISVGAGVDFNLLQDNPITVFSIALLLMIGKAAILLLLARYFKLPSPDKWLFSLSLAQAGEFAFVLFGFAAVNNVMPKSLTDLLILSVAITMLLTPLLFILYERVIAPRAVAKKDEKQADEIEEYGKVILSGVGRFGQVIARLLMTNGYQVTVLDHDPQLIEQMSKVGIKTYYGDPTRPDLLHAAGVHEAELFIAAVDDRNSQTLLVETVAKSNPNCKIIARAYDRHHVYELELAGAHVIQREMFESALTAGRHALELLGHHKFRAAQKARAFRKHDRKTLELLREHWSREGIGQSYIDVLRAQSDELYQIMQADQATPSEGDDQNSEKLDGMEKYESFDQQGV